MTIAQMDTEREQVRYNIVRLLDELPPEALPMVETFVRFMQANANTAVSPPAPPPTPWLHPSIPAPAKSLDQWLGLLDGMEGYEGDALADTEALYDEV